MDTMEIDSGAASRATRQRHVLVVDDDPSDRERVAKYLTLNDFRVTPAESGKRMMEILRDEPIDLVALETTLRGEDGQNLARRLRETSMVPIIIVTSRAEEADRVAPPPDRERSPTALARRRLDARRYLAVGVDHRRRARRQQIAEEPQLGG